MADIRTTSIEADCFYHIYNRGINGELIFKSDRNYSFFLNKVVEFLTPVCDVYAYCLMPNHFHLLVKIKSDLELSSLVKFKTLTRLLKQDFILLRIFSQNNLPDFSILTPNLLIRNTKDMVLLLNLHLKEN